MKPMVAPVSGAGEGFLDAATSRRIIGALRPFVQHPTRAAKKEARHPGGASSRARPQNGHEAGSHGHGRS